MTSVIVVNPHAAAVENVNAGGADAPAYGLVTATLTDAEIDTAVTTNELVIVPAALTDEEKRRAAKILKLGKFPSAATS